MASMAFRSDSEKVTVRPFFECGSLLMFAASHRG
jgi:hypothetical protein